MTREHNGLPAELIHACNAPAGTLTGEDFRALKEWRPEVERERREEKRKEIAAVLAQREREDRTAIEKQARVAVTASQPATTYARAASLTEADAEQIFGDAEALERWCERNPDAAVPVCIWFPFLIANRTKRIAIEERLKALEAKPSGVPYEGVWSATEIYPANVFVSWDGSLWCSVSASVSRRPGSHPEAWRLAVKRGTDAR